MLVHVLLANEGRRFVLDVQDAGLPGRVAHHTGLRGSSDRVRIPAPVDDRDSVPLLDERLRELVHVDVLAAGVRQPGRHLPLVDAVVGNHEDVPVPVWIAAVRHIELLCRCRPRSGPAPEDAWGLRLMLAAIRSEPDLPRSRLRRVERRGTG